MRQGIVLRFAAGIFALTEPCKDAIIYTKKEKRCRVNGQSPSYKIIEVIAGLLERARRLLLCMVADHIEQHDNLDTESAERNELRWSQVHVTTPSVRLRGNRKKPPRVAREMPGQ